MKKVALIISLILAMVIGLGGCTSISRPASVPPPNPPITVTLDKIGVYHNGEHWLRGLYGEVYVHVVVSDGNIIKEKRFPPQEGQYYPLARNETVDIGVTILSVDEVGDSLTITAIGYEEDGNAFEQLVYQALGLAIESQTAGVTGRLLEPFELNLGEVIGKFFGDEDDWLGSYERTWSSDNNWGIGTYTDIACEDKDGTLCLRLWFTIESPGEPLTPTVTPTEPAPSHDFPITDSFNLEGEQDYYESRDFPLQANQTLYIILKSDCPIHAGLGGPLEPSVCVMINRTDPPEAISEYDARWIKSCELQKMGNQWEASVTFRPDDTGLYQLFLLNMTTQSCRCEYTMSLERG